MAAIYMISFILLFRAEAQVTDVSEVTRVEEAQTREQSGTTDNCYSALGQYDITDGGKKSKVAISRIKKAHRVYMSPNAEQTVFRVDTVKEGKKSLKGLLIHRDDQWFLVSLNEGVTHPYPTTAQETSVYAAFQEFYEKGNKNPSGVSIEKLQFSRDMMRGRSASQNISFDFNPMDTIDRFLKETEKPYQFFGRLGMPEVRVPPQMYELASDPEFKRAQQNRQYSKMMDMIYQKALEISDGDIDKALFIGLIATDLRKRGPCGAIYGKRGHTIVPISIFDNERPEMSVVGTRRDAAQHFFGYAMISRKFGQRFADNYSSYSKSEHMKIFTRYTREFHSSDADFDETDNCFGCQVNPFRISNNGEDLRLRPNYDKLADLHYNRLGADFGRVLASNPRALPSSSIKSEKFVSFEQAFGVQRSSSAWWTKPEEVIIQANAYMRRGRLKFHMDNTSQRKTDLRINYQAREDVKIYPLGPKGPMKNCTTTHSFGSGYDVYLDRSCQNLPENTNWFLDFRGRKYILDTQRP